MKIRLIGDHSSYHCGSAAAFAAILAETRRHGHIVDGDDFDLLIVNGEGTMHHDSKGCRRKILEIENALGAGRHAMLVNSVWQENPPEITKVLRDCDEVVVREVCSARVLAAAGIEAQIRLDQCYFHPVDHVEPVDFGGAVALTDFWSKDFGTFVRVTGKWAQAMPYIDMQQWRWSKLVRSLATSSLLVTGRHHAVYAACKARTPFLALEGNTHKISGLLQTAGIDIPVFRSFESLKENLDWPAANRARYEALFDWMEAQPRWRLAPY